MSMEDVQSDLADTPELLWILIQFNLLPKAYLPQILKRNDCCQNNIKKRFREDNKYYGPRRINKIAPLKWKHRKLWL